ncbi:guanyl-nucleotide exchange factor Vps901 [Schizosaccharomyces japonicus yFS275]|uniref:Guanyl-nucleotide exchange factor Vps901 n=1 Tax=Schizosaccharomyces japonicus (strain yFS275 / FY16936) TaxID=402676 RepID=B6K1A8_SCHJY|nr:guanyl-nucleotide exchange factor Vps901 [Schizosaccharomyces japonicus yFS275]EEB07729.1 guanyl-nucleotide exchange factor Vps901 [Schizosaccharomyces japonicus yFS275]
MNGKDPEGRINSAILDLEGLTISPTTKEEKSQEVQLISLSDDLLDSQFSNSHTNKANSGSTGHSRDNLNGSEDAVNVSVKSLKKDEIKERNAEGNKDSISLKLNLSTNVNSFDFHSFLEQLRSKPAEPVAKYLKSFLSEFSKRQWPLVYETKLIKDFINFIDEKLEQYEPFKSCSEEERENAREGMEKLVMNRLYTQVFSPEIKKAGLPLTGEHSDDIEQDRVVSEKMRLFSWVREEHLDITPHKSNSRFFELASKELRRINDYHAPRDKIICILNCCKVIYSYLRIVEHEECADKFVPILIYVLLRANPNHLVSNIQYIQRFRNPIKLAGEVSYYLSTLEGALSFIQNLDRSSLTISEEDFNTNIENSLQRMEQDKAERHAIKTQQADNSQSASRPSASSYDFLASTSQVLKSLQKPISSLTRLFNDPITKLTSSGQNTPNSSVSISSTPSQTPHEEAAKPAEPGKQLVQSISQLELELERADRVGSPSSSVASIAVPTPKYATRPVHYHENSKALRAARTASLETAEAERIKTRERQEAISALRAMFPAFDTDVIEMVLTAQQGRLGSSVDSLLEMS